jgi:hypothetical protein
VQLQTDFSLDPYRGSFTFKPVFVVTVTKANTTSAFASLDPSLMTGAVDPGYAVVSMPQSTDGAQIRPNPPNWCAARPRGRTPRRRARPRRGLGAVERRVASVAFFVPPALSTTDGRRFSRAPAHYPPAARSIMNVRQLGGPLFCTLTFDPKARKGFGFGGWGWRRSTSRAGGGPGSADAPAARADAPLPPVRLAGGAPEVPHEPVHQRPVRRTVSARAPLRRASLWEGAPRAGRDGVGPARAPCACTLPAPLHLPRTSSPP